MAVINISFGGQNVAVDIPDIALESTMNDVLVEARAQKQLLSNIANRMGADKNAQVQATRDNTKSVTSAINENTKETRSLAQGMVSYARQSMANIKNTAMGIKGDEKFSDMVSGFGGALGLGAIGAQVGTFFGIMEEFGHSMSNLRRIGSGYADQLVQLRSDTADIGLGLEGFGALVAENGVTIRALGDNTTDGSNALIRMTKQFRNLSEQAGYYGMSSQEMTRLLVDEAELRRRIQGTDIANEKTQAEMVISVNKQLKLNEAMAKLTGQDIRDRIKASQQFKSDAVNAAIMSKMTKEQIAATEAATQGLSQLGPSASAGISQALTNMLGGFDMFTNNEQFAGFAQMATAAGVDVRGALQNITSMIQSGADPATIQAASDQLANSIKNINPDMLITQAIAGNEAANAVLTARMESVSSGAETLGGSVDKINQSIDSLDKAIQDGSLKISGTLADMEVAGQRFRDTLMSSILEAFGAGNLNNESVNNFSDFVKGIRDLPENDKFQGFVKSMTDLVTVTSGAQGLVKLLQGQDLEIGDVSFLTAALADAIGRADIGAAFRGAGMLTLGDEISKAILSVVPDANKQDFWQKLYDENHNALKVFISNFGDFPILRNEMADGMKNPILSLPPDFDPTNFMPPSTN